MPTLGVCCTNIRTILSGIEYTLKLVVSASRNVEMVFNGIFTRYIFSGLRG